MKCSKNEPMCACYKEKANLKKSFDIGWSIVKGDDVCEHCAGWGDHEDCECEYEPSEVHRGGQCVYCDSGDECEASESGLKCPYDGKGN